MLHAKFFVTYSLGPRLAPCVVAEVHLLCTRCINDGAYSYVIDLTLQDCLWCMHHQPGTTGHHLPQVYAIV